MQSGQAEASIGIYGKVIYTGKKGEGPKAPGKPPVHTLLQEQQRLLTLPLRLCRPPHSYQLSISISFHSFAPSSAKLFNAFIKSNLPLWACEHKVGASR